MDKKGNLAIREIITDAVSEVGTQGALAQEAGIDASQLTRFLSGESGLKIESLEKIMAIGKCVIVTKEHLQNLETTAETLGKLWSAERARRNEK